MKNEIGFEIKMVPEARLELARLERRGILNPLCLPIPPLGHRVINYCVVMEACPGVEPSYMDLQSSA